MTRLRFNGFNVVDMGVGILVNISLPNAYKTQIQGIMDRFKAGKEYDLSEYKEKRSLKANAYLWKLADELAKVLKTTKEHIYKVAIYNVGKHDILEAKDTPTKTKEEVAEEYCRLWNSNGLGWYAYQDKIKPEVIYMYYGSSVYNTAEMSRIIEFLQDECRRQGIEIRPKEEVESMLKEWKKEHG